MLPIPDAVAPILSSFHVLTFEMVVCQRPAARLPRREAVLIIRGDEQRISRLFEDALYMDVLEMKKLWL
jgi:hypothetical protein